MLTILKKALLLGLVLTIALIGTVAAEENAPSLTERIDMLDRSLDAMQRALGGTDKIEALIEPTAPAPADVIEPAVEPAAGDPKEAAGGSVTDMGYVDDTIHAMKDLVIVREGAFTFTRAVVKDGLLILTFSYKNTTGERKTISDLDFLVKDADGKELPQTWECDLPWFDGTTQPDDELTGDVCFVFSKSSSYTIVYEPFNGTVLNWALAN